MIRIHQSLTDNPPYSAEGMTADFVTAMGIYRRDSTVRSMSWAHGGVSRWRGCVERQTQRCRGQRRDGRLVRRADIAYRRALDATHFDRRSSARSSNRLDNETELLVRSTTRSTASRPTSTPAASRTPCASPSQSTRAWSASTAEWCPTHRRPSAGRSRAGSVAKAAGMDCRNSRKPSTSAWISDGLAGRA